MATTYYQECQVLTRHIGAPKLISLALKPEYV